jgi:hypothetical protein
VNIAVVVRSKGVLEFYSGRAEHNSEAFWNTSEPLILRVPRGVGCQVQVVGSLDSLIIEGWGWCMLHSGFWDVDGGSLPL